MDRSVATPVGGGTDQLLHEEAWSLYVDRAKVSTTACDHYCVIEEKGGSLPMQVYDCSTPI